MATDFKCARCGRCCKTKKINITYSDIMRWESEGRFDILSEVNLVQFKKDIDFTGFYFGKTALREGCPFLLFDGVKTNCRIYETRPKCCRNQPECIEPSDEKLNDWKSCQGIKNRTRFDDSHFKEIRQDEYEDLRQAYIHRKQIFEIIRQARIIDPSATLNVNAMPPPPRTGWTYTGTSPYLDAQDQPTNQIFTGTKSVSTNDFGFQNLEAAATSVSSVILNIYCLASSSIKSSSVYVWDGASYSSAYTLSMPTAFAYVQIDVSAWLNTVAKVNAAQIYITSASTTQTYTVDHAYLDVTYATPVTIYEYERFFDPIVSATKIAGGVPNTQTIQEFAKLFDVFNRPFTSLQKQLQEYAKFFDPSITKIAITQKTFQEFTKLEDVYSSRTSNQKQLQEFINLGDIYSSLANFQRQIQDYSNLGDIPTYRTSIQQQMVEYITLSDTVSATAGAPPITQTIQEFINLFDVFSRPFASFQKQLQEYMTLFDPSIAKIAIIQKIFQEFVISADIYNSRISVQKQFQEFINLNDVYSSLIIFQRQIQEYINLGDILTYRASIQQQIIDYIKLWDSISVTAGVPPITQTIYDYIKVFDSLTRSLVKAQVINEWINIFESITTAPRYVRVSYEWIKSFDVISERLTSTRQIQEWIRLFDTSTQTSSLIRIQTINEWLRIFESATMATQYIRISIEWAKLFENQTRLVGFNRQIVEYTTIFDTVTATTEELSNLIMQLIKCVEIP